MTMLNNFELLATQVIFPSNKDAVLQSNGLYDILKNAHNQQLRFMLSGNSKQFADMSRVIR